MVLITKSYITATAAGKVRALVTASSSDVADITGTASLVIGTTVTIAVVVELNNVILYVDGVEDGTPITSAAEPAAVTQVSPGSTFQALLQIFGWARLARLFDGALSASKILQLST